VPALPRSLVLLLWVACILLAVLPFAAERFYVQLATQMMVLAIFALSLDLLVGFTGLVSFGHAAFYGIAGYGLAILSRDAGFTSIWLTLPICLAACGLTALAIGWLAIRTSGIYFIMVTLAFSQMIYFFFNDARGFGGSDGLYVMVKPRMELAGTVLFNLQNRTVLYYAVLASLVGTFLFLRMLLRSPFGQVINAIRINESRTRAIGYPVQRYKLASFAIAGVLAGLAGYLGATQFGYVNPAHIGWRESGKILIVVVLGGAGTLWGPVLGAFVVVLLEDTLSAMTEHWLLLMGGIVIGIVLLLPKGMAGLVLKLVDLVSQPAARREPYRDLPQARQATDG